MQSALYPDQNKSDNIVNDYDYYIRCSLSTFREHMGFQEIFRIIY